MVIGDKTGIGLMKRRDILSIEDLVLYNIQEDMTYPEKIDQFFDACKSGDLSRIYNLTISEAKANFWISALKSSRLNLIEAYKSRINTVPEENIFKNLELIKTSSVILEDFRNTNKKLGISPFLYCLIWERTKQQQPYNRGRLPSYIITDRFYGVNDGGFKWSSSFEGHDFWRETLVCDFKFADRKYAWIYPDDFGHEIYKLI